MANLHLVTGHAGEPHVKATDDASLMQAIYGGDSVVLDRNNAFSCDVISNNIIRVYDGEALMQGRYIKMDKGNYVDLNIDNGHTGYRRIDVIAIEYTKDDETNIEEANLVVVKGSETQQEEATVPELVEGDTVDRSASTNQMALYYVKIDGLSITDVEQAYAIGQDFQLASGQINTIGAIAHRLVNVAKKGLDVFKQLSYEDEADVQTRTDYESLVNGLDDAGSYVFPPTQNGDGGVTPDTNAITRLEELIDDERTAREKLESDVRSFMTTEVNDRMRNDTNLQKNIDDVMDKYSECMSNMGNFHYELEGFGDRLNGFDDRFNWVNSRVTNNANAIEDINTTVELLYKTLKKDNSWTELAELVRSGKASQFLNYGDQIEENWIDVDNNNKEYSNPWDIAKFEDVETREGIIKGMFLKTHWATLRPIQFSHNRAFYACRDGLSAGTYYITLGADWGTNAKKDKSYQFTITNDVPEGGKLAGFYSMPDVSPSNWKVYVYAENGIDILENAITVTEGTEGTSLGTLKLNERDGNLNSMQETAYGNNDWEISAYRQYLNSRKGKGAWWIAQDEWDIAPDQLNTVSGFLCGISDELYNSMQTVKVKTWKNNPTYGGVESYTYDKVFLPSKEELYYTPQKAGEGTYYPLMKEQLGLDSSLADYTNYAPNITYAIENHSSAQYVRLRSAGLNNAYYVWIANTSGNVGNGSAAIAFRCTPACVIG